MKNKSNILLGLAVILLSACSLGEKPLTVRLGDPALIWEGKHLLYHGKLFSGMMEAYGEDQLLKSSEPYFNGLLEGISVNWYEDGNPESFRNYHKGEKEGVHEGWWPNGKSRFEYHFDDGIYEGAFKEWYEDGKLLNFFTYEDGEVVRAMGWRENGKTYINFEVRNGRKYGLTNARLCYSLYDEKGIYKPVNP